MPRPDAAPDPSPPSAPLARGQGAAEYVGALAIAAVVVLGLLASAPGVGRGLADVVCSTVGALGGEGRCAAARAEPAPERPTAIEATAPRELTAHTFAAGDDAGALDDPAGGIDSIATSITGALGAAVGGGATGGGPGGDTGGATSGPDPQDPYFQGEDAAYEAWTNGGKDPELLDGLLGDVDPDATARAADCPAESLCLFDEPGWTGRMTALPCDADTNELGSLADLVEGLEPDAPDAAEDLVGDGAARSVINGCTTSVGLWSGAGRTGRNVTLWPGQWQWALGDRGFDRAAASVDVGNAAAEATWPGASGADRLTAKPQAAGIESVGTRVVAQRVVSGLIARGVARATAEKLATTALRSTVSVACRRSPSSCIRAVQQACGVRGSCAQARKGACVLSGLFCGRGLTPKRTQDALSAAKKLGDAGEAGSKLVARYGKNTESITVGTRNRIPDVLDEPAGIIGEVKNVERLSPSSQLRDYARYAKEKGLTFQISIREETILSSSMLRFVRENGIRIVRELPRVVS